MLLYTSTGRDGLEILGGKNYDSDMAENWLLYLSLGTATPLLIKTNITTSSST